MERGAELGVDGRRERRTDEERGGPWPEPAPPSSVLLHGTLKNPRTVNSDLTFQVMTKGDFIEGKGISFVYSVC